MCKLTLFVAVYVAMCCSDKQYEAHQIHLEVGLSLACEAEDVTQCVVVCYSVL